MVACLLAQLLLSSVHLHHLLTSRRRSTRLQDRRRWHYSRARADTLAPYSASYSRDLERRRCRFAQQLLLHGLAVLDRVRSLLSTVFDRFVAVARSSPGIYSVNFILQCAFWMVFIYSVGEVVCNAWTMS